MQGQRDKFIVTLEREISILTWDGRTGQISGLQTLAEVDKDTENRLNDGKCDPKGRLWTGTVYSKCPGEFVPDLFKDLYQILSKFVLYS